MSDTLPTLYCANHPNVETGLRCNNCSKPICPKCAVLTPTGYRCKECVRNQQKVFDTAVWYDPVIGFVVALVLSYIGSRIASAIGGFFTLFIAPVAGVIIAEAVRLAVRRRRSRLLFNAATAGVIIGCLPMLVIGIINVSYLGLGGIWSLIWPGAYTAFVTSTVLYRLRGIRIG